MSASIFGDRMAYRVAGGTPWHNQGRALPEGVRTATEGLLSAKLNYGVVAEPLFRQTVGGVYSPTSQVVLVRPAFDGEPEAVLGYASDEYHPLQNWEVASMLDPLTDVWPLETMGALGKGETVFMTLDAGMATVGGDDIHQYLFAWNGHDGSSAFKISVTPVRVVCSNTCITGLRQASVTASVRHTSRVLNEAKLAIDLVSQLRSAQKSTIQALSQLTKIRVGTEQMARILEAVYPDKSDPSKLSRLDAHEAGEIQLSDDQLAELKHVQIDTEKARVAAANLRLAALTRIKAFNDDRPMYANTAWSVYNGITETATWREGGSEKAIAKSILLDGPRNREMATAFRELVALAN